MNFVSVVHSGDKSSWIWSHWAHFYWKYWDRTIPTYFISEEKEPPEGVISIKTGKGLSWGRGLENALSQIPEEYVLYLHEDYFPFDFINFQILNAIPDVMEKNKISIMKVCGKYAGHDKTANRMKKTDIKVLNSYVYKYPIEVGYGISHRQSIWKKSFLLHSLRNINTPWEHEIRGSDLVTEHDNISAIIDRQPIPTIEMILKGKLSESGTVYYDIEIDGHYDWTNV